MFFSLYALAQEPGDKPEACQPGASATADDDYRCGLALAALGKSKLATDAFEGGRIKAPGDKRFPIELAGLAFRAREYGEAKRLLHRALRIDPSDGYANEFLATLYFLDGNLDAALKYWNRAGKPIVQNVTNDPQPRIDAALLDRAFTFAPGTMLSAEQLRETQQRLDLLEVFSNYRFDAAARLDGRFDVVFRNSERNGWGSSKISKLLNLFDRLPFQTITPEAHNLRGRGVNFVSLYRFDAQKRRLFLSFGAPLQGNPKWRYGVSADLRKENWDLRYPSDLSEAARNVRLEKAAVSAQLQAVLNPDWNWSSAVEVADRRYLTPMAAPGTTDASLAQDGPTLKYVTQLKGKPLRVPEKRLVGTVTARAALGKWWASSAQAFAKVEGGVRTTWMPQEKGDDYALSAQLRAGKTFGALPLDELNVLGVEGDSGLWLRGHAAVHAGKKGAAPMGRNFLLFNSEWDKNVYQGAIFGIKLGPFLDMGRVTDPAGMLGSRRWLIDSGVQLKLRVFGGLGITLSYGRGLVDGSNALHASALR